MCNGILLVGFIASAISGTWDIHYEGIFSLSLESLSNHGIGLIGGAIWACGNLMVVPIISILGYANHCLLIQHLMGCCSLGLGLLLWSSSNLIIPYFIGRFGAFGIPAEVVPNPNFSIVGTFMLFSFLFLFCAVFRPMMRFVFLFVCSLFF